MKSSDPSTETGLRPWHFFAAASLLAAAVALAVAPRTQPENLLLVAGAVLAAGWVGAACHGTVAPLLTPARVSTQVIEGQARHRLEREKRLVLRSIKELEFDQAMGKIGASDFSDLSGRLRTRALALMQRLEGPQQRYRDRIEQEVRRRVAELGTARSVAEAPEVSLAPREALPRTRSGARLVMQCDGCGTVNDLDARFCKQCGQRFAE